MSHPSSSLLASRSRDRRAPRFAALAGLGILAMASAPFVGCSAPDPVDTGDEAVSEAQQALTTCVTIQRGTFGAVEDQTIASGVTYPGWSPATLWVGNQKETLIKFDVSSLPAGAVVDSATLSLTTAGTVSGAPLWARHATAAWSESTVLFSTFNQQANNKVSGSMVPSAPNSVQTLTLKPSTVQGWLDGTIANNGVLLETMITQPAQWRETVFVSSESPTAALRPALRVCYTTVDHCAPNPCQNGASCTSSASGYTCACAPGYTGTDCQTNIDECAGNPCQNGGACTDGVNGYSCDCASGYTGTHCQTDIDECAPAPCQNGGTCTDHVGSYSCACPPGFTGVDCQTNIDDCAASPCQNGGACTDGVNGYTCSCAAGYAGQDCQVNVDDCPGNACQNGSTCVDGVNEYTCSCAPGFSGTHCQTNIDECAGSPCQNGGACADGINGYTCQCAAGYTGDNCEIDVNDCAPNPCLNGGICTDGVNSHTCQCPAGYSGADCGQAGCVQDVTAGYQITFARKADGSVWTWGGSASQFQVQMSSLGTDTIDISEGRQHACAVKTDGSAWCWGHGAQGALGNGTTVDSATPVPVTGLGTGVAQIEAGNFMGCALKTDGSVWCWGKFVLVPTQVTGLAAGVAQISIGTGGHHTCALETNGSVWCWGDNSNGQLGDGTKVNRSSPVQVTALGTSVVEVSAGEGHTCALKSDGTTWCWGLNVHGQLGDGTLVTRLSPVQLTALGTSVAHIRSGVYSSCVLKSDGTFWCWGYNSFGQLGDGTTVDRLSAVQVTALGTSVVDVTLGQVHTCARTSDGSAWCWGSNSFGQTGTGANRLLPTKVALTCP